MQERYQKALLELQQLQQQYDGETRHGTRSGPQKKWAAKAAEMLAREMPYELR